MVVCFEMGQQFVCHNIAGAPPGGPSGVRTVILNRRLVLVVVSALALVPAGCGSKNRPPNVAVNPGECYVDLTDPEVRIDGNEVKWKVHYKFTENTPHPDAWFQCK